MSIICFNGEILSDQKPVLFTANRSYRYGDGLFETMKVIREKIILGELHFERLKTSLQDLKISLPKPITSEFLESKIIELCKKNNYPDGAKVRLSVSRGNGGLYDQENDFQYLIECWPLNDSLHEKNDEGLIIDVFPDARKSMDRFSNLKTANYLPYVMAALWAKDNKLDDALLLNSAERICDSTIANVFWKRNGIIFTPPLSEGCVAGVMRRYLLDNLQNTGYIIKEQCLTIEDMELAEEVFLTNAIIGIRWVKQFRNKTFSNSISLEIFNNFIRSIL